MFFNRFARTPLVCFVLGVIVLAGSPAQVVRATPPPPTDQITGKCNKSTFVPPLPRVDERGNLAPNPSLTTSTQLRCEGELNYGQRPAAVQRVIRRMYNNDRAYRFVSAMVVDRSPGEAAGSVRLEIRQPDSVRVALYDNVRGTGTPRQVRVTSGDNLLVYNPAADVFTLLPRHRGYPTLLPLDALPLGVHERDQGGTTFSLGGSSRSALTVADALIHPAALISSPIFQSRRILSTGIATLNSRHVWILEGKAIRTVRSFTGPGDGWRMWIDQHTGMVLRLDYLQGTRIIGSAALQAFQIDGMGTDPNVGAGFKSWTLPRSASYQDPLGFPSVTVSHESAVTTWYQDHSDVVIGVVAILILLVLRWQVGRFARREEEDTLTAEVQATRGA